MTNRFAISEQVLERKSFSFSFDENSIDVTDLIYNKKFPHISGSLINVIERGAVRLQIKESQVNLIFKVLQERKEWEETYLTN